jgi:CRISPR/Cas system-associated exonuclease Cas4 (RecB family)
LAPEDAAVRSAWQEAVRKVEARMAASWLERHSVPLRRSVRNYEERRLATLDYALDLARQGAARSEKHGGLGLAPETPLVTADDRLGGQLDAVIPTLEGVVIRDYKTGQIYEDNDGERVVKAAYQLQLRLYAVLYERTQGAWPARLEVVASQGEVVEVSFTPEECEALFEDTIRRLDKFAEKVRRVRDGVLALPALANPGEACRWCPYRPVCTANRDWTAAAPAPEQPSRVDVRGTFQGVRPVRFGLVVLELEANGSSRPVADLDPMPNRNPALGQLQRGDAIGVFDAWQNTTGSLVASDQTVVYKLGPGT